MALEDGLIFLLNQNGDALDTSGNGNNGIISGVTFSDVQTKIFPKSALYDGFDDNIVIPKAGLPNSMSGLTLAAWVYLNNIGKDQFFFVRENTKLFFRVTSTNKLQLRHVDIGDGATTSTASLTSGGWVQIAATWDGSDTALYINGTDTGDGEPATGTINFAGTEDVFLGESSGGAGDLDSYMVQTGYWNRGLSASEISDIYNGGAGVIIGAPEPTEPRSLFFRQFQHLLPNSKAWRI